MSLRMRPRILLSRLQAAIALASHSIPQVTGDLTKCSFKSHRMSDRTSTYASLCQQCHVRSYTQYVVGSIYSDKRASIKNTVYVYLNLISEFYGCAVLAIAHWFLRGRQ